MLCGSAVSVSAADSSAAEQTVKALGIMVGDEQGNMNLSADVIYENAGGGIQLSGYHQR